MQKLYFFFLLSLVVGSLSGVAAQSGCPDCMIDLPVDLPEDTIYLSDAPDGQVGQTYNEDLSFRLPKTTTPVAANDPNTPPGFPISKFTINNVSGLPPGISWEANALVFETADTTDGCVKLCGQPLAPGLYEVQVEVTARILIIDQTTSFSFPLLITPAAVINEGFTATNTEGCGSVTASFTNNLPANGNAGYSYFWDFGNGNMSLQENPVDQTYTMPGTYTVNYRAIVDTTGFFLRKVTINEVSCTDLFNGPDLKINVFDPAGDVIYTSQIVTNATLPLVYELLLPIDTGKYSLQVIDDDNGLGGQDDECALVNFSQTLSGTFATNDFSLIIELLHPVDTLAFSATITVYEQPAVPEIFAVLSDPLCAGDDALLIAEEGPGTFQWYRDSLPIAEGIDSDLAISESGDYYVVYTSPVGCQATSELETIVFADLPEGVALMQEGNLLSLIDPGFLPAEYTADWLLNDSTLLSHDLLLCAEASGEYVLVITDLETGCAASDTLQVMYDPLLMCSTPTREELAGSAWAVYPNPGSADLHVRLPLTAGTGQLAVYDRIGRLVRQQAVATPTVMLSTADLPSGLYIVQWIGDDGTTGSLNWIKQ